MMNEMEEDEGDSEVVRLLEERTALGPTLPPLSHDSIREQYIHISSLKVKKYQNMLSLQNELPVNVDFMGMIINSEFTPPKPPFTCPITPKFVRTEFGKGT